MPRTIDIKVQIDKNLRRRNRVCVTAMNNAWVAALMWDIEFPARQQRDCVSVPKPQRTATAASKGVVWTYPRMGKKTSLFFLSAVHTHATRASAHVRLLNRNTQHAVSWSWSLGFGWRDGQLSTPVFKGSNLGVVRFSGSRRLTHMCCEVHREATDKFGPPCSICWPIDEEWQWQWKALICDYIRISTSGPFGSSSELLHQTLGRDRQLHAGKMSLSPC